MSTILGSVPGLLLPFLLVGQVGNRLLTDAYFLAVETTLLAATVFALVLKSAAVSYFVEWHARTPDALAQRSLQLASQAALAVTGLFVLAATALAVLYLPRAGIAPETASAVRLYLIVLLPLPGLMAWTAVYSASLYAVERWRLPLWTEGLRSTLPIALVLAPGPPSLVLVTGALSLGEALRLAVLRRAGNPGPTSARDVLSVLRRPSPAWPVIRPQVVSMAIGSASPWIDKLVAGLIGASAVTVLTLAERIYYTPQLLLSNAVALVLGTRWAQMIERGDEEQVRSDFLRAQRYMFIVSVATASVVWFALELFGVRVARSLDLPAAELVATTQAFVVGLPAAMSAALSTRLYVTARSTRILVQFAVILVLINVVADAIGAVVLGVDGIAWASTMVRWVSALLYFVFLPRALRALAT